jgi:hypothetical protein
MVFDIGVGHTLAHAFRDVESRFHSVHSFKFYVTQQDKVKLDITVTGQ